MFPFFKILMLDHSLGYLCLRYSILSLFRDPKFKNQAFDYHENSKSLLEVYCYDLL